MHPRRSLRLAAGICLLSLALVCQGDDLIAIYELALVNDPSYRADMLSLQADQQVTPQARAALLPNVNLSAARVRNRDELSGDVAFITEGKATFDSNEYGINLTQTLFDRAKQLALRQARSREQIASFRFTDVTQELIVRVVRRYFAALAAIDNLDLAVAERKAVARQLELAEKRLEVGLGIKTDLYDAQARFQLAEAQAIRAQNLLDDARQALAEIIGETPKDLNRLKPDSPLQNPRRSMDDWLGEARDNNLQITIARRSEEVALQELKRQRAGRYPTLELVLQHNVNDAEGSVSGPGLETTATDALVQLNLPIYQGGLVSARAREAELRYRAAQKQTESAIRATDRSTRAAFLGITTSLRQVAALDQAVTASESALEARSEGFQAGLNTNLDVLDAQRDLFRAKRDYLRARYDYILNILRLKRSAGTLNEQDLELVNKWLG